MANWLLHRRLAKVSSRLRELRSELAMIDEQLAHLAADADDQEIRALVAETPSASFEARDARRHADAMSRHRSHVVAEIDELERRQDELLDELTASS
jgi:chromosome segregation ATPase